MAEGAVRVAAAGPAGAPGGGTARVAAAAGFTAELGVVPRVRGVALTVFAGPAAGALAPSGTEARCGGMADAGAFVGAVVLAAAVETDDGFVAAAASLLGELSEEWWWWWW